MKVIELSIEDWQADVLAVTAARKGLTSEELLSRMAVERVAFEVDSVCRRLFGDRVLNVEIEHRLAELFRR